MQILLRGSLGVTKIRDVSAEDVNRLVSVPGIIINASRTRPKATEVTIHCNTCGDHRSISCGSAFAGAVIPRRCPERSVVDGVEVENVQAKLCPLDPYHIVADKSRYVDQQTLKLQETPEDVPTGEMPRHLLMSSERYLADAVSPGTRVRIIGVVSIFNSSGAGGGRGRANAAAANVRTPFLRVLGIEYEQDGAGRVSAHFSPEEEQKYKAMAASPDFYEKMASSVAPAIRGDYTDDLKKAILCLLMGGSRKLLPDGMRLRGDINVLLLGDPSMAKSQLLKFVEKVAPVGVYTSGKGSSAAGLTASVIRDGRGEFYLEGGAMVLADGGVVCIDEFDKMREEDRVAIHEAMEQQTISVAKAGITTILNSRAAVLAAANPVYGRYDDERSAAENIDFLPTILSRFDLIFIVRDIRNAARDMDMARHIMNIHINAGQADVSAAQAAADDAASQDVSLTDMKRFISYARSKCAPRLSPDAARMLRDHYVTIRNDQRARKARDLERTGSTRDSVIPITVRQLEALIRISEAVAKTQLATEATVAHVDEALRLFKVSTLDAANSGLSQFYMTEETREAVQKAEAMVKRMLVAGAAVPTAKLRSQLMKRSADNSDHVVRMALQVLAGRGEITFFNERRMVRSATA